MRILIGLQLRAVTLLLVDTKKMGRHSKLLGEAQTASLTQAEIRLVELERDVLGYCFT